MRLYLDAAPVIYTVEQMVPFADIVDARLAAHDVIRVASDLTRLECRVKPIQGGNTGLLQDYDEYFANNVSEIVVLSRDVMDRATEIRAQYRFKTPDAIHLAAAVAANCDSFLTNDHRLDRFTDLTVEVVRL
ncbi:MAG: PIN domain-containing protein [Pirellulaceae bacterium]|nr:PIN domain-containing protein [Pirellulaceae bacterium]